MGEYATCTRGRVPARNRQALIDASLSLFAEFGFADTSVASVVAKAGLTKGAFYHYFSSKDDLLALIHDEFLDHTQRQQQQILQMYDEPAVQLAHMVYGLVTIIVEHQPAVKVFFREQEQLRGEQRRAIVARRNEVQSTYQDTIARGIRTGELDASLDDSLMTYGLLGMCNWTYQWYRPSLRLSPSYIAHHFTRMILRSAGVDEDALENIMGKFQLSER